MLRYILIICGILYLALAVVGLFLPLLPTTPLVLLAAVCFARSSGKLHSRLINNKIFGPVIREWEDTRTMSLKAKILSLSFLNLSILLSIIYFLSEPAVVFLLITVDLLVSIYIYRIPTRR